MWSCDSFSGVFTQNQHPFYSSEGGVLRQQQESEKIINFGPCIWVGHCKFMFFESVNVDKQSLVGPTWQQHRNQLVLIRIGLIGHQLIQVMRIYNQVTCQMEEKVGGGSSGKTNTLFSFRRSLFKSTVVSCFNVLTQLI